MRSFRVTALSIPTTRIKLITFKVISMTLVNPYLISHIPSQESSDRRSEIAQASILVISTACKTQWRR